MKLEAVAREFTRLAFVWDILNHRRVEIQSPPVTDLHLL